MKIIVTYLLIALGCLEFSAQVRAADIYISDKSHFTISGQIVKGDFKKTLKLIIKEPININLFMIGVFLDSPGGDVNEAMRIAGLVSESFGSTFVEKDAACFSACTLIWAGGVSRSTQGKLGVHRLSLARNEISVTKTEKLISPATQSVEGFLNKMGIPRKIIDKMNETPPSDLFIIDRRWLVQEDLINTIDYRPTFLDVAEKQCGQSPYLSAMKTLTPPTKETALKWEVCVGKVQEENQKIDQNKIVSLIIDGLASKK